MHYETTYIGLHKWTQAMFEKLGWMVLAKAHGHDFRITEYKTAVAHLQKAIAEKLTQTKDPDKIADLKVLANHVKILSVHIGKEFKK